MPETWHGSGDQFTVSWAGSNWVVRFGGSRPGLCRPDLADGGILALDGLASPGRHDAIAFRRENLVSVEVFRSRLQATYAPADWADLQVRASWSPEAQGPGMNLEVQATALSVGVLRAVEVFVVSTPGRTDGASGEIPEYLVQPRHRRAAALSYDGREPVEVLERLRTDPIPRPGDPVPAPVVLPSRWNDLAGLFVEMVHPDDLARRRIAHAVGGAGVLDQALESRTGLFGHNLEKGVVLRARLRGIWLPATPERVRDHAGREFRRFLDEPPPLGM